MKDELLDYSKRLRQLRDGHSDASTVLLGFPGVAGGHMPQVIPPSLLFYSPSVLLLHDVVFVPDYVFDLDTEETLATVPYRLLETLAKEGIVQFVSCANEPALRLLQPEAVQEVSGVLSALAPDIGLETLTPSQVQRVIQDDESPEGTTRIRQAEIRQVFRNVYDALFLHGLAETLRCPYAFANNDLSIHAARHRTYDRDLESMVICAMQFPIAQFSILLDDTGQYADLVPEATLIPQRLMNGVITVREPDGLERPFRCPDEQRSLDATSRVLSLRARKEFTELRKLMHEWHVGFNTDGGDGQELEDLGRRCELGMNRLLPDIESALAEVGRPASAVALIIGEPDSCSLTRNLTPPGESHLLASHVEDYGPTPALSGFVVTRRRTQSGEDS